MKESITTKQIYDTLVFLLEKRGPVPGETEEDIRNYLYLDAGHVDSFNIIQLILEIEDEFGISLLAEDTESVDFRSIGGLIRLVERKLNLIPD